MESRAIGIWHGEAVFGCWLLYTLPAFALGPEEALVTHLRLVCGVRLSISHRSQALVLDIAKFMTAPCSGLCAFFTRSFKISPTLYTSVQSSGSQKPHKAKVYGWVNPWVFNEEESHRRQRFNTPCGFSRCRKQLLTVGVGALCMEKSSYFFFFV